MTQVSKLNLTEAAQVEIRPGKMGAKGGSNPKGESFGFTNYYMTRNGKPFIPVVGEFHFSRFSHLQWEEELLKMKAGGVHIVATYVFWNFHEEEEGVFDWSGSRNLRHFIDLCAKLEYPLILRIGPFCHGEVRNGGIPDWVFAKPVEIRSNDPAYLQLARKLYREIAVQMKGSLYQEGGPVIAVQLENEFMHCGAPNDAWGYKAGKFVSSGTGGNDHLAELHRIAEEAGIRPMFFTATAWGGAAVPEEGFLPMLAGYAYTSWIPNQPPSREFIYRDLHVVPAEPVNYDTRQYPVAYCEMAGGMQVSYNARPFVPADSIEAMTLVKLASGSNLVGYYMYHGGSNPVGKKGYMNEQFLPKITYDYQSPLGEFGRIGESYDRIRSLSLFLESFGGVLAPMTTLLPEGQSELEATDAESLRWCVRHKDGAGFVFLNNYQDQVELPARSFRIELETNRGPVSFPFEGNATLPGGMGVVLPFHLDLHGVSLISATAQLLTQVENDGEHVVVFYAHDGLTPEFVVAKPAVAGIETSDGQVSEHGDRYVIYPAAGKNNGILLRTSDGKQVRFITLSRQDALQTYRFELWGQPTVAISDGPVIAHHNQLVCTSPGRSAISVSLFPAPKTELRTHTGQTVPFQAEGLFQSCTLEFPAYTPHITVTKPTDKSALLQFAGDWPSHVEDVWLEIDYDGDVAEAYLNGKLMTDHIHYGKTWCIGLKDFYNQLEQSTLHLSITPQRKGTVHTIVNQAQVERFEGVEIAVFHRIEAIPHYRVSLFPASQR
ncbi:beta-galactosidase [Paenibacillus sp. N4]|uniref:beta-galactosidase n=1 Tax=Paenibacillus vietnamensis TaxID=2590547 RepID=UPI001CD0C29C|nr:beta-galactosidase [Paenibacillus vietnamensis]MCA0755422.1 beta-galactosidase [Paenibacillus vietnamensis]